MTTTQMIDGKLHIPQLQFLIPSPLDGDVDVHALGGQKDAYEGFQHAIPSRDCAYAAVNQAHPHPMLHDNTFALLMKREYIIGMTYSMSLPLNGQSVSICVNIYQIKKWYDFDECQKGSNMISLSSITKGYYFYPTPQQMCLLYMWSQKVMMRKVLHLS